MIARLWALPLLVATLADDESALRLPDLPGYREALTEPPGLPAPAAVGFRDLWENPQAHRGRRVRVEGRVVRRFRQGAVGAFPPLTELWIVSPAQDPFCLVFPTAEEPADDAAEPGATARFDGTFLKLIRFRAADDDRLAPLIVGPRPPTAFAGDPLAGVVPRHSFGPLDWIIGGIVGGFVVLVLLRHALARPARRAAPLAAEPPPEFIDGREQPS